ncbi:MAG: hypothetical protein KTR22_10290 [Flavobacteriaceae bacterium]|nr:hypothetical protein [Flavobacteriaceae bacterium]
MKTVKTSFVFVMVSLLAVVFSCSPDSSENEIEEANIVVNSSNKVKGKGGTAPNGARYTNTMLVEYEPGTTETEKMAVRFLYYNTDYLVYHEICFGSTPSDIWYVNDDCLPCRPNSGGTCKPTCDTDNNGDVNRTVWDGACGD